MLAPTDFPATLCCSAHACHPSVRREDPLRLHPARLSGVALSCTSAGRLDLCSARTEEASLAGGSGPDVEANTLREQTACAADRGRRHARASGYYRLASLLARDAIADSRQYALGPFVPSS